MTRGLLWLCKHHLTRHALGDAQPSRLNSTSVNDGPDVRPRGYADSAQAQHSLGQPRRCVQSSSLLCDTT